MKDFTFDEKKHVYTLDGIKMYGVTNVLGVIAKPALIQWAANEAVKHLMSVKSDRPLTDQDLEDARVAHRVKKEDSATKGTDIHSILEGYIKSAIANGGKMVSGVGDTSTNVQVQHFIRWAKDNDITFLESEKRIYSEKMWVAGTVDMLFIKDGKKYVGDIKTTSGIYDRTPFFQCAAYQLMLEEMGHTDFVGRCIVRIGKDESFEVVESDHYIDKVGFIAALELFKALEVAVPSKHGGVKKVVKARAHKLATANNVEYPKNIPKITAF